MKISSYEEMDMMQIDMIREIGSMGTGYAANSLSGFLNEKVRMTIPEVSILGFNDAMKKIGDPEEIVAAVLVEMSGEFKGIMLFILRMEFIRLIASRIMGEKVEGYCNMTPMMRSAMEEIGNIMISSYANAVSGLTGISIRLSVPEIAVNMLGGILSVPMAQLGLNSDKILMINGDFIIGDKKLDSKLMMLPDMNSLNVLMERLGVMTENGK